MKKRMILIGALCAALAAGLCACGSNSSESSQVSGSSAVQSGTEESSASDEQTHETNNGTSKETGTDAGSTDNSTSEETQQADFPEEGESMESVLTALAENASTGSYDASNTEYFWTAVANLMRSDAESSPAAIIGGDKVGLPSDYVKEYASALFADFDGNSDQLPELSSDVSKSADIEQTTDENDEIVYYVTGSASAHDFSLTSCKQKEDGSYQLKFTVDGSDYTAKIKDSTYTGSGDPIWHYTVTDFQ